MKIVFLIGTTCYSFNSVADNAKFDPQTGNLYIPNVEVPGPFGGTECYQVDLGLMPDNDIMAFALSLLLACLILVMWFNNTQFVSPFSLFFMQQRH